MMEGDLQPWAYPPPIADEGNEGRPQRGGQLRVHDTPSPPLLQTRATEDDLNEAASSEFARLRSRSEHEMDAAMPQPGVLLLATRAKKETR